MKGFYQYIKLFLFLTLLSGCTQDKSVESVFPEEDDRNVSERARCGARLTSNRFIVHWEDGHFSSVLSSDKKTFIREFLKPRLDQIRYAEHDELIQAVKPLSTSGGIHLPNWGTEMVEAPSLWERNILGEGISVAVIDSGADVTHPELADQILINTKEIPGNNVDDDNNGFKDDYLGYDFFSKSGDIQDISKSGHGTHVSGVILASHEQGEIFGMAPKAKLLPLNFMDKNGSGFLGDAIRAINYAASRDVDVINASWGGMNCSPVLQSTIQKLEAKGILIVTAAGNDGINIDDNPMYPAAFNLPLQITVGASTMNDFFAHFSNEGRKLVHLIAPGSMILSTVPKGKVESLSGTSMAAPFVSGAVALLRSYHPEATPFQVKQAILESTDRGIFPVLTEGRLNVEKAAKTLDELLDP